MQPVFDLVYMPEHIPSFVTFLARPSRWLRDIENFVVTWLYRRSRTCTKHLLMRQNKSAARSGNHLADQYSSLSVLKGILLQPTEVALFFFVFLMPDMQANQCIDELTTRAAGIANDLAAAYSEVDATKAAMQFQKVRGQPQLIDSVL